MTILLTDEEIRVEIAKLPPTDLYTPSAYKESSIAWNEFIVKAQLKKVVEWGNGDCDCGLERNFDIKRSVHRHLCPKCWQALLKEAEK